MIPTVEEPVAAFFRSINQAIEDVVPARKSLLAVRFCIVARLYDISLAPGFKERPEPGVDECRFIPSKRPINKQAIVVE